MASRVNLSRQELFRRRHVRCPQLDHVAVLECCSNVAAACASPRLRGRRAPEDHFAICSLEDTRSDDLIDSTNSMKPKSSAFRWSRLLLLALLLVVAISVVASDVHAAAEEIEAETSQVTNSEVPEFVATSEWQELLPGQGIPRVRFLMAGEVWRLEVKI